VAVIVQSYDTASTSVSPVSLNHLAATRKPLTPVRFHKPAARVNMDVR